MNVFFISLVILVCLHYYKQSSHLVHFGFVEFILFLYDFLMYHLFAVQIQSETSLVFNCRHTPKTSRFSFALEFIKEVEHKKNIMAQSVTDEKAMECPAREFYGVKVFDSDFYDCAIFGTDDKPSTRMTKENIKDLNQLIKTYVWRSHSVYYKNTRIGMRVYGAWFTQASAIENFYPELINHIDDCTKSIKIRKLKCQVSANMDKSIKVIEGDVRDIVLPTYKENKKEKLYFILKMVRKVQIVGWNLQLPPWKKAAPKSEYKNRELYDLTLGW